ncbi:hypothetical protein B0T39_21495 [Chromobacterium haemolyticum]|nr:hypothetical protein B0T39_21495 [Chromobacterium haemolyticum]
MLMYHLYIPLFRSFSPCLALAREIVNTFREPVYDLRPVSATHKDATGVLFCFCKNWIIKK